MAKIDDCLIDTAVVVSVFESEGKEIIVKKKAFVFAPAVTINIPSFFTPTFSSTPSFPHFFLTFLDWKKSFKKVLVSVPPKR